MQPEMPMVRETEPICEPASAVNGEDVQGLVQHFGTARALDVIWWTCRCHYMTRVADGFQLPLERDNVFAGAAPTPHKEPVKGR